ncbi:hypothetical protein M153_1800008196 [Pseudoloma neurophilia]|uniref:Exocyst complex component Sec6 n=1 Tax=Pseudoloma neurophilia TaxID=146866 RepID=A0A0R0M6U7_9MICR|nr:hypothetical protein M153_1800008196 [Pseudoloma neurophilia]
MDTKRNEELLKTIKKVNIISRNLDKNYKKMKKEVITTPSIILDSFEQYSEPQEKLDRAINFFDRLVDLIEHTEDGILQLEGFKKNKGGNVVHAIPLVDIYGKIDKNLNFLQKHPKAKKVRKFVILAEDTQNQIYLVVSEVFFKTVYDKFLEKVPHLDLLAKFLVKTRDKTEIIENYISIFIKKLSFEEKIDDDEIFINLINKFEKELENVKELNNFLFESKLSIFLNQNLINILAENIKTDILRFITLKDTKREYWEILTFLKLYSKCKSININLLEYIESFLQVFFDEIENWNTIRSDFGPEKFVIFTQSLFKEFTDEFSKDFVYQYDEKLGISNRKELEDKILITILTKLKHLSLNENEIDKNAYLISNLLEISQMNKQIGDLVLFDEIQNYKKQLLEIIKDMKIQEEFEIKKIIKQVQNWKMGAEIKNSLIEHIKKICKEKAKKISYKGNIDRDLDEIDK